MLSKPLCIPWLALNQHATPIQLRLQQLGVACRQTIERSKFEVGAPLFANVAEEFVARVFFVALSFDLACSQMVLL